jgi:hypothetical protein
MHRSNKYASEMIIYQELTNDFNRGRIRAVLSSGQAVVMHGLAIMSKEADGVLPFEI